MKDCITVRVENATSIRKLFLKVIASGKSYIVSKDFSAQSVILPVSVFEKLIPREKNNLPALAVLGARPCDEKKAEKTIASINSAKKYFSKVVFVFGEKTEKYVKHFCVNDVRIVFNKNSHLPMVTSLKLAITALSKSDKFLTFCFLSKPCTQKLLKTISKKAADSQKMKKGIVITKISGSPSHPIAFARKYFKTLLSTRKELGIPYIIRKFKRDIVYAEN